MTELRDHGMDLALRAEGDAYKAMFVNEVRRQARTGQEITAETVTAVVGLPSRPNVVGSLFSTLARRGEIRPVGYRMAKRESRHASRMLVWIGTGSPVAAAAIPPVAVASRAPVFGDVQLIRSMRARR